MRILMAVILTLFMLALLFAAMLYGFILGKKHQFQKDEESVVKVLRKFGYDEVAEYFQEEVRKRETE